MTNRKTLTLSEIELSYLEWGNPEKTPLLLLHGLADQAVVWSNLGEELAPHYHIIAPDLRGHGESSKPDETHYIFSEVISDLEALCDALGWDSAHILGHSWGAKVLAYWAQKSPQHFRSMILVDPFFIGKLPSWLSITFPILYRTLSTLKGMGPFTTYEEAETQARQLAKYQPWNELQQAVFHNNLEQKADGRWGSKFTISARNGIFKEVMQVNGLTRPLNIPALLILPKKGLNRMGWQIKPYHKYLNNLEIVSVPGNHWAFLGEPKTFNQTVAEFLRNGKS
ncbi:MAG: alpha/beta hydrolase [Halothece sp. Uz-M2-17]|nr:alpha/beta hydrolase [Halothece sp. Uz-M2-17]